MDAWVTPCLYQLHFHCLLQKPPVWLEDQDLSPRPLQDKAVRQAKGTQKGKQFLKDHTPKIFTVGRRMLPSPLGCWASERGKSTEHACLYKTQVLQSTRVGRGTNVCLAPCVFGLASWKEPFGGDGALASHGQAALESPHGDWRFGIWQPRPQLWATLRRSGRALPAFRAETVLAEEEGLPGVAGPTALEAAGEVRGACGGRRGWIGSCRVPGSAHLLLMLWAAAPPLLWPTL